MRETTHLTLGRKEVDHLLNCTSTVHVERNVDQVLRNGLAYNIALLVRGELKQLLTEVVAERVWHGLTFVSYY